MASRAGRKVEQIIDAAFAGNLRRMKKLAKELDDGKGIAETLANLRSSDGRGVLHSAAAKGRTKVCKYLLEELKLPVDEKDCEDCTPLAHASINGHLSTAECLIENGAAVDMPNLHNHAALHTATRTGNIEMMQLLLSRGADVNAPSSVGTPLQLAAESAKIDAIKTLLDHGANPNSVNHVPTALDMSLMKSLECTRLLLQAGANPNYGSGGPPLAFAAREGNIKLIKCLLKAGADPNILNDVGLKPVEIAARHGRHEAVEILFPVTSPISECPEWSVPGLMKHMRSKEAIHQVELRCKDLHLEDASKGDEALRKDDYMQAVFCYSAAVAAYSLDATVWSKRSFCFLCLGDGESSLSDARACIKLRPDWTEGYHRAGVALIMLKMFRMAADTLLMGLKLDPENIELRDAFRFAVEARMKSESSTPQ